MKNWKTTRSVCLGEDGNVAACVDAGHEVMTITIFAPAGKQLDMDKAVAAAQSTIGPVVTAVLGGEEWVRVEESGNYVREKEPGAERGPKAKKAPKEELAREVEPKPKAGAKAKPAPKEEPKEEEEVDDDTTGPVEDEDEPAATEEGPMFDREVDDDSEFEESAPAATSKLKGYEPLPEDYLSRFTSLSVSAQYLVKKRPKITFLEFLDTMKQWGETVPILKGYLADKDQGRFLRIVTNWAAANNVPGTPAPTAKPKA